MDKSKSTLKESIIERIEALKVERDAYVVEANQQIAAYNGAIGELTRLLNPPTPEKAEAARKEADVTK